ncbi:hypothetical protein BGX27_011162 [Mortierella sp. AM989]|nr:hypothetical protein BGX27_011162 [Mortierella sp. AM989]
MSKPSKTGSLVSRCSVEKHNTAGSGKYTNLPGESTGSCSPKSALPLRHESLHSINSGSSVATRPNPNMPWCLQEYADNIEEMAVKTLEQTLPRLYRSCKDLVTQMDRELARNSSKAKARESTIESYPELKQDLQPGSFEGLEHMLHHSNLGHVEEGSTNCFYKRQSGIPKHVEPLQLYERRNDTQGQPESLQSPKASCDDQASVISDLLCPSSGAFSLTPQGEHESLSSSGCKRKRNHEVDDADELTPDALQQISRNVSVQVKKRHQACSSGGLGIASMTPVSDIPPRLCMPSDNKSSYLVDSKPVTETSLGQFPAPIRRIPSNLTKLGQVQPPLANRAKMLGNSGQVIDCGIW